MKKFKILLVILFLNACAHNQETKNSNLEEKKQSTNATCKNTCPQTQEVTDLKKDKQNICWRAIKKACLNDFKCVERGVKYCESTK